MQIRYSIIVALALSACSSGDGRYPSLAPRAAEAIDPRLPVVRPVNERPVSSSLASQLTALVEQARSGEGAFQPAIAQAEQLASVAGARQSESWIAAEEALSAAVAARKPTAMALSDIDALGATALQRQGGIAPNDLSAIKSAGEEVAKIANGQTDRIDAIQKRLGI
jgi:hypothetical protein